MTSLKGLFLFVLVGLFCPLAFGDITWIEEKTKSASLRQFSYTPSVANAEKNSLAVAGIYSEYYIYRPRRLSVNSPVLLALHGARRTGHSMVDSWQQVAEREGVIVIAPSAARQRWRIDQANLDYVAAVLDDVEKRYRINTDRFYVFGHSNGGVFAYFLATKFSARVKGVTVHAATLQSDQLLGALNKPDMPITIGLFLGSKDQKFSLSSAYATVKVLDQLGIGNDLFILRDHNHWYYADADQINQRAWRYMLSHRDISK